MGKGKSVLLVLFFGVNDKSALGCFVYQWVGGRSRLISMGGSHVWLKLLKFIRSAALAMCPGADSSTKDQVLQKSFPSTQLLGQLLKS